jgi:hypothetical protein
VPRRYWGVSVFAEVGDFDRKWNAAAKLGRTRWPVLFRAGDIYNSGLNYGARGKVLTTMLCTQTLANWLSDWSPARIGSSVTRWDLEAGRNDSPDHSPSEPEQRGRRRPELEPPAEGFRS